jgi:hypothetical protein
MFPTNNVIKTTVVTTTDVKPGQFMASNYALCRVQPNSAKNVYLETEGFLWCSKALRELSEFLTNLADILDQDLDVIEEEAPEVLDDEDDDFYHDC